MNLTPIEIGGRSGVVAYLNANFEMVDVTDAVMAKVVFDDGSNVFYDVSSLRTAGDVPGHEFHGNQWVNGEGVSDGDVADASIAWAEKQYPRATLTEKKATGLHPREKFYRGEVDGLRVSTDIPNTDSIGATFSDASEYDELPGIREVSIADLDLGNFKAADDNRRVDRLADAIKESGEIKPLIVVIDGTRKPYILEGGHRAPALLRLGKTKIPAVVIVDHTAQKIEPRTATRHKETAVHVAADAHFARTLVTVQYAFAAGRAAVDKTALRRAESPAAALVATEDASGVVRDALLKTLPKTVLSCVNAGGVAGLQILHSQMRTAGDVPGHEFHGNQYSNSEHQAAYECGFYHGQTGYGFQKHIAGRKGSAKHAAYRKGYDEGVDHSGDLKSDFRDASHKFASVQVNIYSHDADDILHMAAAIPNDVLAAGGRESQPHITVKYGLHSGDPLLVRDALRNEPAITATLGSTSFFETPDYDVVFIRVESSDLERLNAIITAELPTTSTHDGYTPHVTLAYVKPGTGHLYAGNDTLAGTRLVFERVVLSDAEDNTTVIPLTGSRLLSLVSRIRQGVLRTLRPQVSGKPHTVKSPFNLAFNVSDPNAIKWAREHVSKIADDISATTKNNINDAVARAYEGGSRDDAYDEILAAVGDDVRADMIAHTEIMTAANEGQRIGWDQAVDAGLLSDTAQREWIDTEDDNVCPLCDNLDGQRADLNGEYQDDGGDGPPRHQRCRCTEGIVE